jgi:hypothetical protein
LFRNFWPFFPLVGCHGQGVKYLLKKCEKKIKKRPLPDFSMDRLLDACWGVVEEDLKGVIEQAMGGLGRTLH